MSFDTGLVFALLAQVAALVWGASSIASSVRALAKSVEKLDRTVAHLDDRVDAHEVRIAVVEKLQDLTTSAKAS